MQHLANTITVNSATVLWVGLLIQFILRRGQSHREILFATAGIAVAITLFLPPVATLAADLVGSSGPCNLLQNLWGVGSSGLILLAVSAGQGRGHVAIAAVSTLVVMGIEGWLAQALTPSPAGCVTTTDVPAASPFWLILINWHLVARTTALVTCRRDIIALTKDRWARYAVWWYTAGFAASTLYWALLAIVLLTERHWPGLSKSSTIVFAITSVTFAIGVWLPVLHRGTTYAHHTLQFLQLYRELPAHGWTATERRDLWNQSLRSWYRAPQRAAYRIRIAQADHHIDQTHHERQQKGQP